MNRLTDERKKRKQEDTNTFISICFIYLNGLHFLIDSIYLNMCLAIFLAIVNISLFTGGFTSSL